MTFLSDVSCLLIISISADDKLCQQAVPGIDDVIWCQYSDQPVLNIKSGVSLAQTDNNIYHLAGCEYGKFSL